jgi:hypothetical protein
MVSETQGDRRQASQFRQDEGRGALWSLPDGQRLPNLMDSTPLLLGDPVHPARLRPTDLEHPENFHSRLVAWLLRQV